jgi:hypothetical protein
VASIPLALPSSFLGQRTIAFAPPPHALSHVPFRGKLVITTRSPPLDRIDPSAPSHSSPRGPCTHPFSLSSSLLAPGNLALLLAPLVFHERQCCRQVDRTRAAARHGSGSGIKGSAESKSRGSTDRRSCRVRTRCAGRCTCAATATTRWAAAATTTATSTGAAAATTTATTTGAAAATTTATTTGAVAATTTATTTGAEARAKHHEATTPLKRRRGGSANMDQGEPTRL